MMGKVKKVTSNHLFLPLFALALLLVFNAFATPGFFAIEFQNGQFYGRIIDILNRASILVILSMGMTFVIATGGIDISQGSVIAISGAICCSLIGGAGDGTANMPLLPACLIAVLVCALCGVWNGFQAEDPAHGGHTDPADRRTRHRHADYQGAECHRVL